MDYVTRKNPGGFGYEIPQNIADLMEKQLSCINTGKAKNGLRWDYQNKGTIFFHKISRSACSIYILPTSVRKWKTKQQLQEALKKWGQPGLAKEVSDRKGGNKHLEVHNVTWRQVEAIAPILVDWVYFNETGRHAIKLDAPKKKKVDSTENKKREVNEKLILTAIENLGKTGDVGLSEVYHQMELDSQIGNYELTDNWKETVKETLKKMSE